MPKVGTSDASDVIGANASQLTSDGLAALIRRAGTHPRGPAPVEKWNPPFCGDLDLTIKASGEWFYLGAPIARERMVRLFSTVLRKDSDAHHYLVTPVEKVRIKVEDAPFLAVEMHVHGDGAEQRLTFRTNVGDTTQADADHPIRFAREEGTGGVKPYVLVRARLEALCSRALLYQMADYFSEHEVNGEKHMGVWSGGAFFPLPREMEADDFEGRPA